MICNLLSRPKTSLNLKFSSKEAFVGFVVSASPQKPLYSVPKKLFKSAVVATLPKAHLMTNESDDRSPLGLAFGFHLCIICKVEKERLSPTTPVTTHS